MDQRFHVDLWSARCFRSGRLHVRRRTHFNSEGFRFRPGTQPESVSVTHCVNCCINTHQLWQVSYSNRWSNVGNPGQWLFHIGRIGADGNANGPDVVGEGASLWWENHDVKEEREGNHLVKFHSKITWFLPSHHSFVFLFSNKMIRRYIEYMIMTLYYSLGTHDCSTEVKYLPRKLFSNSDCSSMLSLQRRCRRAVRKAPISATAEQSATPTPVASAAVVSLDTTETGSTASVMVSRAYSHTIR